MVADPRFEPATEDPYEPPLHPSVRGPHPDFPALGREFAFFGAPRHHRPCCGWDSRRMPMTDLRHGRREIVMRGTSPATLNSQPLVMARRLTRGMLAAVSLLVWGMATVASATSIPSVQVRDGFE